MIYCQRLRIDSWTGLAALERQVGDATPAGGLCEALGLAPRGKGAELAPSGHASRDGPQPVNPSGGLLSRGHPLGATGTAQLAEIAWQLRGRAGARQVARHEVGIVETMGGGRVRGQGPSSVLAEQLSVDDHISLYPLLDGDVCHWLAADFDGGSSSPVRYLLQRRGRWLRAYSVRPSRCVGGWICRATAGCSRPRMCCRVLVRWGDLIAAPLRGRSRRDGPTVFFDLATMEPHEDQWAYLSSLHRLSPREVGRLAGSVRPVRVGVAVARLDRATASRTQPQAAPVVHAKIGAGISVDMGELTPAVLATLNMRRRCRGHDYDAAQEGRREGLCRHQI